MFRANVRLVSPLGCGDGPFMSPAAVSVVMLTANRLAALRITLEAMVRQTHPPAEIVVVVNETKDQTWEFLAAVNLPFPLKVVRGPGKGLSEARSLAVLSSTSPWVLFLDDDCEAHPELIARLLAAADHHQWEAVGGSVLPATLLPSPSGYGPELTWLIGCSPPGYFGPLTGRLFLPQTANVLFSRALYDEIPFRNIGGKLNVGDSVYQISREDSELWRRWRRAGKRVGVEPRAIAWHHLPADRVDLPRIRERARADGIAHWRREKLRGEVREAARDVLWTPVRIAHDLAFHPAPFAETIESHAAWGARQLAFLEEAVDDRDAPVHPQTRAAAYLREGARLALAGNKAILRKGAAVAYREARTVRPVPTVSRPPRRLLVVLYPLLGDAVLAMPMVEQLAAAFPETRITLLTGELAGPLLAANAPDNVTVVEVPAHCAGRRPDRAFRHWQWLQKFRPDAVLIAYTHGLSPAPFFFLGQAPVVSWKEDNGMQERMWGEMVTGPVEKNFEKSEVVALLDLLAPFEVPTRLARPRISFSERAEERRERILKEAGVGEGEYIAIHLEAGVRDKFWPEERMGEVVSGLLDDGLPVILVGSREGRAAAERLGKHPGLHNLQGFVDSDELAAVLAGARLFVGSDSGPGHVAQAVHAPSLVIFGATEVHRWGPLPPLKGEEPPPFHIISASDGNFLVEEVGGLPSNFAMMSLGVKEVRGRIGDILGSSGGSRTSKTG